jgi:hypothetical protein
MLYTKISMSSVLPFLKNRHRLKLAIFNLKKFNLGGLKGLSRQILNP